MELVDHAESGSGACVISGTSDGPFVRTDFQTDPRNLLPGLACVNAVVARELGEAAGCVRPETYGQTLGDLSVAHSRISQLEEELAQSKAELDALMVFVGPKLGARAAHVYRLAGMAVKKELKARRDYIEGDGPAENVDLFKDDVEAAKALEEVTA